MICRKEWLEENKEEPKFIKWSPIEKLDYELSPKQLVPTIDDLTKVILKRLLGMTKHGN